MRRVQMTSYPLTNSIADKKYMPLIFRVGYPEKLAEITADGIFKVHVEPNDENAKKFIELVNKHIRPITAMVEVHD